MLSLIVAYFVTSWMYEDRARAFIQNMLTTDGTQIIQTFQSTPSAELVSFMQNLSGLSLTQIQLYDRNGTTLLDAKEWPVQVSTGEIESVLRGEKVVRVDQIHTAQPVVGLPLQADGQPYALFLTVTKEGTDDGAMNAIHLLYVLILFIGSFLILIAARYIVNPIRQLTAATRKMAKGQFDVELPTKRKDEIGILSVSFNQMAKELAKLDQMRRAFVSNVSHEIGSPLTSISGFSKALKQKQISEESRLRYLTIIEEESERLSRLSQNLLQLSHLQHNDRPLHVSAYRLDEQLRKIVITLEPQWGAKEIAIDLNLKPVTIRADEDQLSQVWINLISNSIKFMPVRGEVRIETVEKENRITVIIADNGIGIPEEERTDIFKPFHKVDKARNSSVKGNGLGLAIVKQIVDLHRGDIAVSGQPGSGAIFEVSLPQ
ncbi:sensor histidine kinase [Brevibacillus fulvus]|uniref:Heme sensor protein HssS n=1 Tax=Brevibacillus fulvus TaxID=1125967 RepID=A0A939BTQ5_9BACL|nr:HAMP domain-containing sensor histidine kinase [Brevibacillus fulvus]MBM7589714.1 signal transduction histidine kinase [Brevibacillus fulvus]